LPLLVICALFGASCSHAPTVIHEGESPYFGSTKVQRYKLANGLRVLILEDHSAPVFAYQTWFRVGSKDEVPGLTGLAHLFEHMMFKETKNYKDGEFDRILESAGAEGENAFTSKDFTAYVQSLPADRLDLIARLESDRMVNLIVNTAVLDKEREVVQNERRFRTENNPNGQLYERLYEDAYKKHSYHWPVLGYEQDLNKAKQKQTADFYKRFYAPNNATIIVVGDVSASKVMSTIQKYYGPLPSSDINRPERAVEPRQEKERTETKVIKSPVEKLIIGFHIPDINSVDFPAIEIARNILGGGRASRLYRKLVDAGIATSVELESAEHADPGLVLFFITLQKGRTSAEALKVIDREVTDLAKGHIKPEERERAIAMHKFAVFDELASNSSKAHFLGFYETVAGRFERGVEIVNALNSVDMASIARVAGTYLSKDNRTVIIGAKGN
jgi:zinc protease